MSEQAFTTGMMWSQNKFHTLYRLVDACHYYIRGGISLRSLTKAVHNVCSLWFVINNRLNELACKEIMLKTNVFVCNKYFLSLGELNDIPISSYLFTSAHICVSINKSNDLFLQHEEAIYQKSKNVVSFHISNQFSYSTSQ